LLLTLKPTHSWSRYACFRRFKQLLQTNDAPLPAEERQYTVAREQARTRLRDVDERIKALKEQLEALDQEREEILSDIGHTSKILHPVRKIPPEILRRIFLLSVDDFPVNTLHPSWMPRIISQVCSRWRNVASSFPGLWSQIGIDITHKTHIKSCKRNLGRQILCAWSQGQTLEVYIHCPDGRLAESFLPIILPSSNNWSIVRITGDPRIISQCEDAAGLSSLKTLALRADTDPLFPSTNAFQHCPELESVAISVNLLRSVVLPWHQIKSLYILIYLGQRQQEALLGNLELRSTRNLSELTLHVIKSPAHNAVMYGNAQSLDHLELPCHRLTILSSDVPAHAFSMLNKLSFPSLTHLKLQGVGSSAFHNINRLLQDNKLVLLQLTDVEYTEHELTSLCRQCPSVAAFVISPFVPGSSLWSNFLLPPQPHISPIFPSLATLCIGVDAEHPRLTEFRDGLAAHRPKVSLTLC
jgi:hypothetical protein